jgi:predicted amidohydrolase YtcJ
VLIRGARLGPQGPPADVLVAGGRIVAVGARPYGGQVLDGTGTTLLPGLVDHHVHLGAWLRARRSTPVGPEGVAATLAGTAADRRGWRILFGLDHQHDLADALAAVDTVDGPCLIVHRTGHATVLNGPAAQRLGVARGIDHGRGLWTRALGPAEGGWEAEQLGALAADLLAQGVVAVQDATPYPAAAADRCRRLRAGLAPVRVEFMGDPGDPLPGARWAKVLSPRDGVPPTSLPLAVHAVEPDEIAAALALLPAAGDHRIEHAALCPPAVVDLLAAAGVTVCANPGFLVERGAALAPLSRTGEAEFLHPVGDLAAAGVPVLFGSDAPVTDPGVWAAVRAARSLRSMSLAAALAAVTSFPVPAAPSDWVDRPADLVLVDDGLDVRAVLVGGELVRPGPPGGP